MKDLTFKKTILIDLDGVLNEYKGNFDKTSIPPIAKGAKDFLTELSKNFILKLFTSRNKLLAAKWLIDNDLETLVTDITNVKELCWLFIDDRCLKFDGDYDKLLHNINNFEAWYK